MKRDLLSDPDVIPDKIKKACRVLLEYIDDNEDAFEENAPLVSVLEDLKKAEDKEQVIEVGTILHHRNPEYQNVQMLVVTDIENDRYWTLPYEYMRVNPPKETWLKWIEHQRKTNPKSLKQCGIMKDTGTAFRKIIPGEDFVRLMHDERYIVKKN
jgi:hypothetical protein